MKIGLYEVFVLPSRLGHFATRGIVEHAWSSTPDSRQRRFTDLAEHGNEGQVEVSIRV